MLPYSPLCDTDLRAYLAFLYSSCGGNGKLFDVGREVCGVVGVGENCGGGDGVGDVVARVFLGICGTVRHDARCVGLDAAFGDVSGGVGGIVDSCGSNDTGSNVGLAGDDVVGPRSGMGSGDSAGHVGQADRGKETGEKCCTESVDTVEVEEPRWKKKKREREVERKRRRAEEKAASSVGSSDASHGSGVGVDGGQKVGDCEVPEWRRKRNGVFAVRKERAQLSKFQDCDEDVRKSLVETQAKRYIAENEAAVVRARNQVLKMEEDSRRVTARLKTGVTEQNVELQRLNLNAKLATHAAAFYKEQGVGFAETVISEGLSSVLSVPSSDSECVSPDSSVSVAMVKKMERVIKDQSVKVAELERKLLKVGVAVELDEVHIMTGQPMDALGLPIEEVADENLSLEDYQATNRAYL